LRNKDTKKSIIKADLVIYCKQIGIANPPALVFTPKEFDELSGHHGRRTKRDSCLGKCSFKPSVVLVNLEYQGEFHRKQWLYNGSRYRWKQIKRRYLADTIYTLVHELVHVRWPTMWHGYRFDKRIEQILGGKTFPEPTPKQQELEPSPAIIERKELEPVLPNQFELIHLQW
jgi:hypothetical protein